MLTLMRKKRSMEIAQIIDEALWKHYFGLGLPVPNWKKQDPQWWIDYLKELELQELIHRKKEPVILKKRR